MAFTARIERDRHRKKTCNQYQKVETAILRPTSVVVWCRGSVLVTINEVNLRRARLVLRWVTASKFNSRCRTSISVYNQPPRSTQPGHPFVGKHEYQPNGGDALRLESKGSVWVASKTVWSPCYTWAIPERLSSWLHKVPLQHSHKSHCKKQEGHIKDRPLANSFPVLWPWPWPDNLNL